MNNQDTIDNEIFNLMVVREIINNLIKVLQQIKEGKDLDIPEDNEND